MTPPARAAARSPRPARPSPTTTSPSSPSTPAADGPPPRVAAAIARAAADPRGLLGQFAAFTAAGGRCFTCRDTGTVGLAPDGGPAYCDQCDEGASRRGQAEAEGQARAAATRARHVDALLARAGTDPFAGRTLDSWPGAASATGRAKLAKLREWTGTWPALGLSLVLWNAGLTGTGKSSLAAALLRERIAATAAGGEFVVADDLIQRLRPSDWQDSSLLHRARHAPALVLDDLGTERLTDFVAERLYYIVNGRYAAGLWTVYTTNLAADGDLREHVGDRVFWRIREVSLWIEPARTNFRDR